MFFDGTTYLYTGNAAYKSLSIWSKHANGCISNIVATINLDIDKSIHRYIDMKVKPYR